MELLRGLHGLRPRHSPCVATIGAFDGVHLGHRAVIEQLQEHGAEQGVATTVVTFEPLPREYLAADTAPARIQSFRERCEALARLGVDRLLCLRFDEGLRSMSAEDFAHRIFVDGLGVKAIVLGDDFRFGNAREGDSAMLRALGQATGFSVHPTRTVTLPGADAERISSTRLRAALADADFSLAEKLLGRPYSISGRVVYGRQLGRELGAPTANIALRRRSLPLQGVFAVSVTGGGVERAQGIANVGIRPTVDAGLRPILEVHLLEGAHELYGARLAVSFMHKIRAEQRFESIDALQTQIHRDIGSARDYFVAAAEG